MNEKTRHFQVKKLSKSEDRSIDFSCFIMNMFEKPAYN